MELKRVVSIRSRFSLAVVLLDGITGEAPIGGEPTAEIEGFPVKPVRKQNGYHIFTDLNEGTYSLTIRSRLYMGCRKRIYVGAGMSAAQVVYISLMPSPQYPFADDVPLVRALVRDSAGLPAARAEVTAVVSGDSSARAVLAQDAANAGSEKLALRSAYGKVSIGDTMLLKQSDQREWIRIADFSDDERSYKLDNPLSQSYTRGAICLPAIRTETADSGEFVVHIPGVRTKAYSMTLQIAYSQKLFETEVAIEGGRPIFLGTITLN